MTQNQKIIHKNNVLNSILLFILLNSNTVFSFNFSLPDNLNSVKQELDKVLKGNSNNSGNDYSNNNNNNYDRGNNSSDAYSSSNIASSVDITTISVLNISLGDDMAMVQKELGKVFVNENKLKSKYPNKKFNNVNALRCDPNAWEKYCTGMYSVVGTDGYSRFKEKFINVLFNKSNNKTYQIEYSQGAQVAENRSECSNIMKTEQDKAKKEYGNNFGRNKTDESLRVRFKCSSSGFLKKTVQINSNKFKKVAKSKTSLD